MAPIFLSLAEVVEIHRDQIERYGGRPGIRDSGLLQSAVAVPHATMGGEYLHGDLFEMAAAYLFHIVKNHPFVDGNKRTALVVMRTFLKLNGQDLTASQETKYHAVMGLAERSLSEAEFADWVRERLTPEPS